MTSNRKEKFIPLAQAAQRSKYPGGYYALWRAISDGSLPCERRGRGGRLFVRLADVARLTRADTREWGSLAELSALVGIWELFLSWAEQNEPELFETRQGTAGMEYNLLVSQKRLAQRFRG